MSRGKHTCKILKEIRRQIAFSNGIRFTTSECMYKGDCIGTCPRCEAEVRYLEQQIHEKRVSGKSVTLAGISAAALAMLMPNMSEAQIPDNAADSISATMQPIADLIRVSGSVAFTDTLPDGTESIEPLIGAIITNKNTGKNNSTDIEGHFETTANIGDILEVKYIGCESQTFIVTDDMETIQIMLKPSNEVIGEIPLEGAIGSQPSTDAPNNLFIIE